MTPAQLAEYERMCAESRKDDVSCYRDPETSVVKPTECMSTLHAAIELAPTPDALLISRGNVLAQAVRIGNQFRWALTAHGVERLSRELRKAAA